MSTSQPTESPKLN